MSEETLSVKPTSPEFLLGGLDALARDVPEKLLLLLYKTPMLYSDWGYDAAIAAIKRYHPDFKALEGGAQQAVEPTE